MVKINKGVTLSDVSKLLEESHIIKSPLVFEMLVIIFDGDDGVRHGEYIFHEPQNVWTVARRVISADFRLESVRIVVPEGSTVMDMGVIFEKQLSEFNKNAFVRLAKSHEGYLFPDTYEFWETDDEEVVYERLRQKFDEKIVTVQDSITRSGRSLEDIIIMASLLEEEARTTETRRMISGILWKRIKIGMLLQVDAVFPYIIGKGTYSVTLEDLKVDSPYNTYKYKGLPQGPITNPGMDSILAALNPIESSYLFYLSDRDGRVYYSRTHAEHVAKKREYLN